jgi:hypothetical protein
MGATVKAGGTPMGDTIKTGPTLIEGGTVMPESLQIESEPWTSFYKAAEIIRELRKASARLLPLEETKNAKCGDNLESVIV